jgi:hypothetical protein
MKKVTKISGLPGKGFKRLRKATPKLSEVAREVIKKADQARLKMCEKAINIIMGKNNASAKK